MRPTTYGYLVGAAFRRPRDGRPVPYGEVRQYV